MVNCPPGVRVRPRPDPPPDPRQPRLRVQDRHLRRQHRRSRPRHRSSHAALLESGFNAERLIARAQEDDVKTALRENTDRAVERGAFGIPTFFVGDEMFFGKDRLRDVEELISARAN